jgi:hypothetical protein
MTRLHSADFGRTGPAVVLSCGCEVLPWLDCTHTAGDVMSLDRFMAREQAYQPQLYQPDLFDVPRAHRRPA